MAYRHGVYVYELDTKILGVQTCDSALPFIVGTAPVHTLPADKPRPVNEPKLIFNYKEFVETFGEIPEGESEEKYTLSQFAKIYYTLYGMSPAVFVNVFDPSVHKDEQDNPDVTKVTVDDIKGGVDAQTGNRKGMELIDEVFTRFMKVVGYILAPGFSHDLSLANIMIAKATNLNNHFKAMAVIDVPSTITKPADVFTFKQNIGSPHAIICWPRVQFGNMKHYLSGHLVGLSAQVDTKNAGIPYESPSNKELRITGPEHILTIDEANYLNSQGVVTIFRFIGGWKLWGNRTACFPEKTDIKDMFIPNRRMANWIENNLVLLTWQKVDNPMNKRLIETVVNTVNIWLNGLVGMGFLLGAKVYFRPEDNPLTDLANGIIRFYITYLAPPPAEVIEYKLEVDVNYFKTLFG
ncbi:MAG: phage tail sheath subtilisin-like domain-containing protein [Candidatus Aenigmatarchaeota archaeon]